MGTLCAVRVHRDNVLKLAESICIGGNGVCYTQAMCIQPQGCFKGERRLVQAQILTTDILSAMPHGNFHAVLLHRVRCFDPHHMGVSGSLGYPFPRLIPHTYVGVI